MEWLRRNTTNLQKMYVIRALQSGMFCIAVIVIFFKENGLSMSQITSLQSLFAIAVMILEVPTGQFADKYGRKNSIIIGGVFSFLGYLTYSLSSTFFGFFIGEMVLAVGICFISGADSAIIYENTEASEGHGKAIKTEGNGTCIGMLSEAVTSFIGGSFLALVSLRFPIYFDVLLSLAVIPVALTLKEEGSPMQQNREYSLKKMIRLMKYYLNEHKEIKWLMVYFSAVSSSTLTMVWLIPMFWVATKTPTFMFGALWAMFLIIAAVTAYKAHFLEEFFGRRFSLIILFLMPIAGYLLLGLNIKIWAMVFLLLFYAARGMNGPIIKSYINKLVDSKERATVLSVLSFIARVPFIFIGPLSGWIYDKYSLQASLLSCGLLFAILGAVPLIFLHKHKVL